MTTQNKSMFDRDDKRDNGFRAYIYKHLLMAIRGNTKRIYNTYRGKEGIMCTHTYLHTYIPT